jgi:hypothetical protein
MAQVRPLLPDRSKKATLFPPSVMAARGSLTPEDLDRNQGREPWGEREQPQRNLAVNRAELYAGVHARTGGGEA